MKSKDYLNAIIRYSPLAAAIFLLIPHQWFNPLAGIGLLCVQFIIARLTAKANQDSILEIMDECEKRGKQVEQIRYDNIEVKFHDRSARKKTKS